MMARRRGNGPKPGTIYRRGQLGRLADILGEDTESVVHILSGEVHAASSVRGHSYLGPGCPEDYVDEPPLLAAWSGYHGT